MKPLDSHPARGSQRGCSRRNNAAAPKHQPVRISTFPNDTMTRPASPGGAAMNGSKTAPATRANSKAAGVSATERMPQMGALRIVNSVRLDDSINMENVILV